MPDFPSRKGATPAEVWAYATRALSTPGDYQADVSALALESGGNLATVKGKTDNLPADPASESGAIKTETASIKTKTDNLPALPAPADEYDTVIAALQTDLDDPGQYQANVSGLAVESGGRLDNIPAFEAAIELSILMITDTEVTLVEKADDKIGILDGFVDLTTMEAGDTIVFRQFMQVKGAGDYVIYNEETVSDVQTVPLLHIVTKTAKDKIKVSAEQTAGTVRTLDVQFYRRLQA